MHYAHTRHTHTHSHLTAAGLFRLFAFRPPAGKTLDLCLTDFGSPGAEIQSHYSVDLIAESMNLSLLRSSYLMLMSVYYNNIKFDDGLEQQFVRQPAQQAAESEFQPFLMNLVFKELRVKFMDVLLLNGEGQNLPIVLLTMDKLAVLYESRDPSCALTDVLSQRVQGSYFEYSVDERDRSVTIIDKGFIGELSTQEYPFQVWLSKNAVVRNPELKEQGRAKPPGLHINLSGSDNDIFSSTAQWIPTAEQRATLQFALSMTSSKAGALMDFRIRRQLILVNLGVIGSLLNFVSLDALQQG